MSLCDSNVWLALALSKHVHHLAFRQFRGLEILVLGQQARG